MIDCKLLLKARTICYNLKILELVNKKNLILRLTQENSIENSIQDYLPYIPKTTSPYSTTLVYSK